jgi:hypothetical protein
MHRCEILKALLCLQGFPIFLSLLLLLLKYVTFITAEDHWNWCSFDDLLDLLFPLGQHFNG